MRTSTHMGYNLSNMPSSPTDRIGTAPDRGGQPRQLLRLMFSPRIAKSALKVSFVVGSVLNVVNNGQHFWTHQSVNGWQIGLNFLVPFCVSSYSAARNEIQRRRGD